jgi:hypothetical protein
VASAVAGFLAYDCDDDLAARLRREIDEADGAGYDYFEFNTFDVELFYGGSCARLRRCDCTARRARRPGGLSGRVS